MEIKNQLQGGEQQEGGIPMMRRKDRVFLGLIIGAMIFYLTAYFNHYPTPLTVTFLLGGGIIGMIIFRYLRF